MRTRLDEWQTLDGNRAQYDAIIDEYIGVVERVHRTGVTLAQAFSVSNVTEDELPFHQAMLFMMGAMTTIGSSCVYEGIDEVHMQATATSCP